MYQKRSNFNSRNGSQRGGGRSFSGSRSYSAGRGFSPYGRNGNVRRQKSLPNDPYLFIKKASVQTTEEAYIAENNFASFKLSPALIANIKAKGYTSLTPIQDQAIGHILAGRDLIGLAATGTGKTAAFLIPLIQLMYQDRSKKTLIITPTRELALQIQEEFRSFARDTQLYSTLIIGGVNIGRQYS